MTRHLERIDRADLVFVFNKGGYVGNGVAMEIGVGDGSR